MNDDEILGRISTLVEEEEELRARNEPLDDDERRRVEQIETALDQCWDLLRQRRAQREFDAEPEQAGLRDPETVETYQQ